MLLDEFISLTDDGLRAAYEAKPVDKTAVRKPFIKALNTAIDQFENGRTKAPNRMWTVNASTVHFVPKFKGQPVAIAGKTEHYLPSDRFADAVKKIIAAVEAGELDEALASDAAAPAKASKASATGETDPALSLTQTISAGVRRGWDETKLIETLTKKGVSKADLPKHVATFNEKMKAKKG